jgi:MFS family permease
MAGNQGGSAIPLPTPTPRRRGLALLTILAAQFMFAMDLLIVVVALPRIQHDLGFNPASLTWVLNAFGLAFGGLLMLGGRLGDMLGQLRAFRTGIFVFVLASMLGGLAQSPGWLIAACVLQGAGAALAGPSVLALVMAISRNADRTDAALLIHCGEGVNDNRLGLRVRRQA